MSNTETYQWSPLRGFVRECTYSQPDTDPGSKTKSQGSK